MLLSAAVIVLNEEQHIRPLLESLRWVDEVVVVDGGSTDNTLRYVAGFPVTVIQRPFDHFAAQRNVAIDACHGDWVLSIDADERPAKGFRRELVARLDHPRFDAYRIPIRSRLFGRPVRFGGTQDDRPIRLFRREASYWSAEVHETLCGCRKVGRFHHGFSHETIPDLAVFLEKMHRYLSLQNTQETTQTSWSKALSAAAFETARRLFWKQGLLDGPHAWAFAGLSGLSQWMATYRPRTRSDFK